MAIYMMRESGWEPGSDTVSYFPLKIDFNDHYGEHNLSNSGATITTLNGVACAYYSGTATSTNNNASVPATRTFNFWIYGLKNKSGDAVWSGSSTQSRLSIGVRGSDGSPFISDYNAYGPTYSADLSNQWVNLCGIVVGHKMYLYVNGVLRVERTRSYQTASSSYFRLGGTDGSERFNGYLSEVIWEKREWTAQEVLDYYNDTKSNYGITDYTYSYDFIGKTISQIANDGWQGTSGWTNTSDGIYRNSWGNPMYISLAGMHTALATATKVTMKIGVYVTKGTGTRDVACRVWDSGKANAYFGVYFGGQNTDNNFAGTSGGTTYSYTGATVFTLIYDLVNKTLSISSTDGNSITPNTYSLTDSYIASVVNGERIYIQQNGTDSKMQSVSLTIEY